MGSALNAFAARQVFGHWVSLLTTLFFLLCLPGAEVTYAQDTAGRSDAIEMNSALVIGPVARGGRVPIPIDPIQAEIVAGRWTAPKAGDTLTLSNGTKRTWEMITAGKDGAIGSPALQGGYAFISVPSDIERVMILEAQSHSMVYVNGEPRAGDPYGYGSARLPILLHRGANTFLFSCGTGRVHARLVAPKAAVLLNTGDTTLPDWLVGEREPAWGAVVVINAANSPASHLAIRAARAGASPSVTPLPALLPLSTRKVAFRMPGPAPRDAGDSPIELQLIQTGGRTKTLDTAKITMRVRRLGETYKRTFRSDIDGSIQYYAVNPAQPYGTEKPPLALFLSLHGAGVEATGQADSYESKSWGTLVAPTNRRPFGFDWEDWGQIDALEVLDIAQRTLHTDPRRTYLTGHSMGGHGTWHVGVTFPDRFAAIGPSAGWISFFSYAGARREENPTPVQEMLQRATNPGDTLALGHNYAQEGVYILHGGADDNVPVEQARTMNAYLAGFHHDFDYHEQPGVGHWWDASDEPGVDCVDWAPMFDFFAHHELPDEDSLRQVDFATANPGASAWSHWLCIAAQIHPLKISTVSIRYDPGLRRFSGTTSNVARIAFRLDRVRPGGPITVALDGQKIEKIPSPQNAPLLWLANDGKMWTVTPAPSPAWKGPDRSGPFKDAFRHRMIFVYGTKGSAEENAWAFAKARFDAETFWYRGNGSVDVMADTDFHPDAERDRGVILYGNADTNAAWNALLADSPVQVRHGEVRIGDRVQSGDDLACLFLRPRPGSDRACVGVVAGSGLTGLRLTDRMPYFVSGVAYPDCIVLGPEALATGSVGVRAAGYFGPDWSLTRSEFAWREAGK